MSAREQRLFTFKAYQVIWFVIGLIEALLALRFVLKLVAANPGNAFAGFVYGLTDVFLAPFFGLTITPNVGGVVLEFHTVIAMLVYALVGWGLQRLVEVVFYRPVEIPPPQAPAVPPHEHLPRREHRHVEPS